MLSRSLTIKRATVQEIDQPDGRCSRATTSVGEAAAAMSFSRAHDQISLATSVTGRSITIKHL